MAWSRGEPDVQRLLDERAIERVPSNLDHAQALWAAGESALRVAVNAAEMDPGVALEIAYTAARKACTALLAVQGLRATRDGGHIAVEHAVQAQFGGPGSSFARYGWLRRRRNDSEYPGVDTPPASAQHAVEAIEAATAILQDAKRLLDSGALDQF